MSALTKASTSLVASASACLNMSDTSGVPNALVSMSLTSSTLKPRITSVAPSSLQNKMTFGLGLNDSQLRIAFSWMIPT
ncbi:MAG: hypothetical protein E6I05_03675 [Chloroflexi bacterium]|nr:MAG: hypothetical protein E6I05_03675 [Chloroflexota bacterium]TMG46792.1 MAG: hypothetical protein E6H85_00935 [Chloroflexota bacterium]